LTVDRPDRFDALARRLGLIVHESPDPDSVTASTLSFVAAQLTRAIQDRGRGVLAVSGGRSPKALLEGLSRWPLDWSRVTVVLVDERAVGALHPLSNTASIRSWLIKGEAACADFRSFVPETVDTGLCPVTLAERAAAAYPGGAIIDVALLGLGLDGHFASIFTGADEFDALVDPTHSAIYLPVHLPSPPAEAPVHRVTLTLARLLEARCLVMPLGSTEKRSVFEQACERLDPRWPVSLLIRQQRNTLHLWLTRS
jgi:6-phosphogluconolactonase